MKIKIVDFFLSCIWRCNCRETWAFLFRNCCIYHKSMNHGCCFQLSNKPYWLLTFSLSFVQFPSKVNVNIYRVSHKPAVHNYGTSASGAFLEQLALWWGSGKRWKLGKKRVVAHVASRSAWNLTVQAASVERPAVRNGFSLKGIIDVVHLYLWNLIDW